MVWWGGHERDDQSGLGSSKSGVERDYICLTDVREVNDWMRTVE